MTQREEIAGRLWGLRSVFAGYVVVQNVAYLYQLVDPEFVRKAVAQAPFSWVTPIVVAVVAVFLICSIRWCTRRGMELADAAGDDLVVDTWRTTQRAQVLVIAFSTGLTIVMHYVVIALWNAA